MAGGAPALQFLRSSTALKRADSTFADCIANKPEKFAAEIKSRPPVLLLHGDRDDLIPVQALFQASGGLASLGVPTEWHVSGGIGHGIDPEGLRHGGEFLSRAIARQGAQKDVPFRRKAAGT